MNERLRRVLDTAAETDWDLTPTPDRAAHVARHYEISADDYLALALKQNGGCAICGGKANSHRKDGRGGHTRRYLSVDHNHETKKVRGLLCNFCNTGIGMFKDNPALLRLAARYLDDNADEDEVQLW